MSQSEMQKEYTFEEDTMITAQAAVNREDVDPVPFVMALLESYAKRAQTVYNSSATPKPLSPGRARARAQGKSEKQ